MNHLIIGDLYNRIFKVQQSHPELEVDYTIWNQINTSLPVGYELPDHEVLHLMVHGTGSGSFTS